MERFTNKSPGALTMEQAIARHKKSMEEYKRQLRQARELAAQGRGDDTEVAHVALGELVVPRALQSPEVLDTLRRAAAEHNIPLQMLSVGNAANRINPNTGQPEFTFGGPEDERVTRNQIPGQQVADLYINRFPSGAHGFGHVGIGVNTDQTQGFYPVSPSIYGPGVVKNDDTNAPHDTLRIPTTPAQDAAAQSYIDARRANPGNYNLYNRQCTDFVGGALRAGSVPVPSDLTPNPFDDMIPNQFFPSLKNRYGQ